MKEAQDMNDSIVTQVIEQLQEMPDSLQRRVLDFVYKLKEAAGRDMPGSQLLQFSGSISQDDLVVMQRTIDEECEKIDVNEW